MIERRFRSVRPELRAADGAKPPMIVSTVAVFDSLSPVVWGMTEDIDPGFFDGVVVAGLDCPSLLNHDANYPLGRTTASPPTLRLAIDKLGTRNGGVPGLYTETDLNPDSMIHRDMVMEPMRRGDIQGASFAFSLPYRGDPGYPGDIVTEKPDGSMHRRLMHCSALWDVSPCVTQPYYPQAPTALRALAAAREALGRQGAERGDLAVLAHPRLAVILADLKERQLSASDMTYLVKAIALLELLLPDGEEPDDVAPAPAATGTSVLAGQQPTGTGVGLASAPTLYELLARRLSRAAKPAPEEARPVDVPAAEVPAQAAGAGAVDPAVPEILPALASLKIRLRAAEQGVM
jgi:HK97 family phage prohead protease